MTVLVVEDDAVLRLVGVLLDPATDPERRAAFAEYVRHDVPDFESWAATVVARVRRLAPSEVVLVADRAALLEALPRADAVIVEDLPIGEAELASAPRLRAVQRFGTVLRTIAVEACRERGVPVLTQRRRTNIAVAEHGFAMLLALAKRLPTIDGLVSDERLRRAGFDPARFDRRHTAGANWGRVTGVRTLHGSQLGLVGLGEIGREMARLGVGAGMEVRYHQRTRLPPEEEAALGVAYAGFDDLVAQCDYLSVHVPKEVTNLIDAAALARVKAGQILINVARASVVDRDALLHALRTGRLGGAGLDVHYAEPVEGDDPFLSLDNVVLTPHLAGGSRINGLLDMSDMLAGLAARLGDERLVSSRRS